MRDAELEPYFAEAASWDLDRARQLARSARLGWSVAGIACFLLVLLGLALMLLMPLKRVEPFLIRVDRTTGVVDVVPTYTGHASLGQAVTRYFLIHYISVCERFNYATAESDYEECGAFQTPEENEAWYARWNPANPRSPLNEHKNGSIVSVRVEDVSFFRRVSGIRNLAQVRYVTSVREGSGAAGPDRHWIATIEYAYGKPSPNPRERLFNPLGFKVLSVTREPEVLTHSPGQPAIALSGASTARQPAATATQGESP